MFKFLFGFDMQIIYEILIVVAIILLIVLMIKFKSFRIFGGILFYILFLIVSAFAMFNVNNYYSSKGGIIGELSDLIKPSANVKDMTFDMQNLTLLETGKEGQFRCSVIVDKVYELNDGQEYNIFVNNVPSNLLESGSDYIISVYDYVFYNSDLKETLNDQLTIKFLFSNRATYIEVTTEGGEEAVKLWNYFFNNQNFILTIK